MFDFVDHVVESEFFILIFCFVSEGTPGGVCQEPEKKLQRALADWLS